MLYHMYYSYEEYTKPDVVVVYGNKGEMSASNESEIHSEISYCNMISSRGTVLVLTDVPKGLLKEGVTIVKTAQLIDQLVPIMMNPFRSFTSQRADIVTNIAIINVNHYFTISLFS